MVRTILLRNSDVRLVTAQWISDGPPESMCISDGFSSAKNGVVRTPVSDIIWNGPIDPYFILVKKIAV